MSAALDARLREWLAQTGATRVVAVTPDGEAEADRGEINLADFAAPFVVTPDTGEVSGPLGALEGVAAAVRDLAAELGAPSVVLAELPTTDDETLAISARADEGLIVVIGDEQYEMDADWPPATEGSDL